MNVKCKWCEEENSEGVPVEPYMVRIDGKSEFLYGCLECMQLHIAPQDRIPIVLPDGWQIITDSALNNYLEQKRALIAVSEEMRKAEGKAPSDTFYPFPAGKLKDMFKSLNDTIFNNNKFKLKLGILEAIPEAMLSGAYCPACTSPLIKTTQQVTSLAISDIASRRKYDLSEDKHFEPKRKSAFVCLSCLTTYIEDRDYE